MIVTSRAEMARAASLGGNWRAVGGESWSGEMERKSRSQWLDLGEEIRERWAASLGGASR